MIKLLKKMTKLDYFLALMVVVFTCAQTYLDLTLPDYMSEITMLVQTPNSEMSEILVAGLKMMFCAVGSLALAIVIAVIAARIASNFSFITRSRLFEKVMNFSMKEVNSFSISSLITRTTNDITQIQQLIVIGMQMLVKAPITAIWAITKIANKNMSWTLVTAVAVVVLLSIVGTCMSLAIPRFKRMQILTDNINKVAKEGLDGLNVVRAYNAENYQADKFEVVNEDLTKNLLFTTKVMSFLMPSIQMISNGLILGIYFVGAVIINEAVGMSKVSLFSDMVVFSSYAMQVIISFMMLVMVFMQLPRAGVAAKRINEVIDTVNSIVDGTQSDGISGSEGEVEFKNVSFKYPGGEDYVLKNISFKANKGELVAFIGSTGCGKTSIINLIPRFYDASEGEVLVNGRNVKEFNKRSLNALIGYVSQRSILFGGTIKSNIAFGEDKASGLDEIALEKALDTSMSNGFVQTLDNKSESYVSQGGRNFSGGQKQRISIARAIYKNPEIFIFDDSFSALDYKTDKALREALNENYSNSTMLIVGQRIGTIKDADKIVVLEYGEVVGIGKHSDLLSSCEVYKQIALSQLSEEELANA